MANITLTTNDGVSCLGVRSHIKSLPIDGNVSTEIEYIKTPIDGVWRSWSKGAPPEFQAFTDFESSVGYIIVSNGIGSITLPGSSKYDMMSATVDSTGIDTVTMPYTESDYDVDMNAKFDTNFYKTVINGVWRSWTINTDPAFQAFTKFEKDRSYVVEVTNIRQKDGAVAKNTYFPLFYFTSYDSEFYNFSNPLMKDIVGQGIRYQLI